MKLIALLFEWASKAVTVAALWALFWAWVFAAVAAALAKDYD